MKSQFSSFFVSLLLSVSLLNVSCVYEHPAISTFTGDMVYTFLRKDTTYSEFVKLLDKADLKGMLSAYGTYTCLAPTNAAFRKYYKSLGADFTIDKLTKGQIDTIARTHIINSTFLTINLNNGVIPAVNMNQRYIEIAFIPDSINNTIKIMLNDSSRVVLKDKELYNGVVQGIDRVLKPSNVVLPDLINADKNLSIFYEALKLTRLCDSLIKVQDENYHQTKVLKNENEDGPAINMTKRMYGYTAFIEDNDVLKSYGINNLQDLIAKANELYPDGKGYEGDYTNRNNSLNKYIAYHLVNKVIYSNNFFYTTTAVQGYTPDEFIETMLPYRIIRTSLLNHNITLNPGSGFTAIVKEGESKTTVNGVYHLLDKMLVYDNSVEDMLKNTRIRFDVASLFPEFANNNIRCSKGVTKPINLTWGDIYAFEPSFLSNCKFTKDTRLIYLAGIENSWYANYQADELKALGPFDITIRLLPVPPGTYELRFNYAANPTRAITQIYVDNKPSGIPLDLSIGATDPRIGWVADKNTDDNGYENDKVMRNRGYMKGSDKWLYAGATLRDYSGAVRRIIGTYTFTEYSAHTLRFKCCTNDTKKQVMVDFIELVPKSVYNRVDGEPESRE